MSSFNDGEVTDQNSHFEETGSDLESDVSKNTERESSASTSSKKKN